MRAQRKAFFLGVFDPLGDLGAISISVSFYSDYKQFYKKTG